MTAASASIAIALATEAAAGERRQWVQLFPLGRFTGRDGRGPWVLSKAAVASVIDATRRYAGGVQLPVDYDHATDTAAKGAKAPAAGWIVGLQARDDGLWGLVEWTSVAAGHLSQREYRYISPTFHHTPDGRVVRLLRAALTNTPNLDLKAVASTAANMEMDMDEHLAELRQLLGLAEDAEPAMIVDKVRELLEARQSAEPDPTRYVPIGDFQRVTAELNRLNANGTTEAVAEMTVTAAIGEGKLPPYLKDWAVTMCRANKSAFDDFIEKTAGPVGQLFVVSHARARPPGSGHDGGQLDEDQAAVAKALGHTADDYAKYNRS